jgi:hypothetical protein
MWNKSYTVAEVWDDFLCTLHVTVCCNIVHNLKFIGNGHAECELWTVKDLNTIPKLLIMKLLPFE